MIITARASVEHRALVSIDTEGEDYSGHQMTLWREDGVSRVQVRGMIDVPVTSTVVPDNEVPLNRPVRYVLEATGATGTVTRTNLVENPSFELTTMPARPNNNAVELTVDDEWAAAGTRSMKITPGGVATSNAHLYGEPAGTSERIGLIPGRTYTMSATIRLTQAQPDSAQSYQRSIAIGRGSAAPYDYYYAQSAQAPNAAGETRLAVTWTQPEDNTFVRLMNGSATVPVWWDAILLEETPTAGTYFDGDTENTPDLLHRWTDIRHQSTSEAYTEAADVRVVSNLITVAADLPVLSHPVTGEQVQVRIVTWEELGFENGRNLVRIPRRRSPIAVTGREYLPTSQVELLTETVAAMRAVRALVAEGDVLLLRPSCPGVEDAYLSLDSRTERRMTSRPSDPVRIHPFNADHMEAPDMGRRGSGDTLQDLHDAVPTTLADVHDRWPGRLFDIADADLKALG